MGIKGIGYGQIRRTERDRHRQLGNIYVADASKHVVEKLRPTEQSSTSGRGQRLGSTARAGSLSAQMIRSMSWIRAARESLSLSPEGRC